MTPRSRSGGRPAIGLLVAVAIGSLSACGGGDGVDGGDEAATVTTQPDAPTTAAERPTTTSPAPTTTVGAVPPSDLDVPLAIDVSLRVFDPATVGGLVGSVLVAQPTLSDSIAETAAALGDPVDVSELAERSPAWCSPVSAPDAPLLIRVAPPAIDEASGDVESVELTSTAPISDVAVEVVLTAEVDGAAVTADGTAVLADDAGSGTFTATTADGRVVEGAFRCTAAAPSA